MRGAGRPGVGHGDEQHDHDHRTGLVGRVLAVVRPHSHDTGDSLDPALEGSAAGVRAVKVSLAVLGVTALTQLGVVLATGSVALLADTIHNLSDALTALPLWAAFVLGRRPATRRFTYGYGRAEDLAGVFILLVIAASAVVAGVESVRRLLDPQPVDHAWAVVAAGLLGFVGNEVVAVHRTRVGRRIGSAALVADGTHARTDGVASLAVVLGALGALAGFPLADPLVGLAITATIVVVLRGAVTDVGRRLMDAVDPALVTTAEAACAAAPGVRGVEVVRLRWVGHRLRAEVAVLVDPSLTVVEGHGVAVATEHELLHRVPRLADATVHVTPTGPDGGRQHADLAHHDQSPATARS